MVLPSELFPEPDSVPTTLQPRLFKATGARVLPQVEWVEIQVKSVLNRVQGMSFKWSINPYRGCSHGCKFCYARLTHWYLDQDGVNSWSSRIFVKINAPEVLRRELAHHSWTREEVHLGTATDPYQPAEGSYKISGQILEALTPVNIVTRSTMVVRDVDLLTRLASGPGAMVCFSIATMDAAVAREIEPDVPPPLRRLEALRSLALAGVPVAVLLAPVIPGITDHPKQLAAVVMAAKDYGASSLWTNALHLGDITRQAFFQYLEHRRPELIPEYERMYRGKYAPSAYRRRVQEVVGALKVRHGLHTSSEARRRHDDAPAPHSPQQLFLF
ncbi:MAG: radical SAM protein [Bacillati bacterium ANGP1]|uniref:Radical SAM protein n=1 Tax=Candidatus Segetimicrobium genomatis TaxID=2569760 RepID=A0A537IJY6_9BACT|nr:MAG: radical SAM protein [Terrabacteria group bacterium ANGP1]